MKEKIIDQRSLNEKFDEFVDTLKFKGKQVVDWCKDNKELAAFIGLVTLKCGTNIYVEHGRRMRLKDKEQARECRIYDRQNNMWIETRRPLTDYEKSIFIQRHKVDREAAVDILQSMGLLF